MTVETSDLENLAEKVFLLEKWQAKAVQTISQLEGERDEARGEVEAARKEIARLGTVVDAITAERDEAKRNLDGLLVAGFNTPPGECTNCAEPSEMTAMLEDFGKKVILQNEVLERAANWAAELQAHAYDVPPSHMENVIRLISEARQNGEMLPALAMAVVSNRCDGPPGECTNCAEMRASLEAAEASIDSLRASLHAREAELTALKARRDEWKKDLHDVLTERDKVVRERNETQHQLNICREDLATADRTVRVTKAALDAAIEAV